MRRDGRTIELRKWFPIILSSENLSRIFIVCAVFSWGLGLQYWLNGKSHALFDSFAGLALALALVFGLSWFLLNRSSPLDHKATNALVSTISLSSWIIGSFLTLSSTENGSFFFEWLDNIQAEPLETVSIAEWLILCVTLVFFFWAILGNLLIGFKIEARFTRRQKNAYNGSVSHTIHQEVNHLKMAEMECTNTEE